MILPSFIEHLVSLYPWERYTVNHELHSTLEVRMYDSVDQAFDQVDESRPGSTSVGPRGRRWCTARPGLNRSSLVVARALMLVG